MRGSFARYFLSRILRTFWNNAHGFERRATSFICFKLFSTCKRVQSPRKEAAKVFLAEILVRDPPRWSFSSPGQTAGGVHLYFCSFNGAGGRTTGTRGRHGTDIHRARHRIERDERPRRRSFDRFRPSRTPRTRRSARVTDTRRNRKEVVGRVGQGTDRHDP